MAKRKKERIHQINHMLLEMANGNFFYRLERSMNKDSLEALSVTLNMLAEEIQEVMIHQGFANTNDTIKHIVQMSFILDSEGIINMVNKHACTLLTIEYDDIIGIPFESLLTESSQTTWKKAWKTQLKNQNIVSDTSLVLTFKTKENLLIPNPCYLTTFQNKTTKERNILITVIHHSKSQFELESDLKQRVIQFMDNSKQSNKTPITPLKQKLRLSFDDIKKLREGHDFIINNLDKKLPSLKEFALQLGTNEFKLKYGFKELYGTSVYRFLLEERLKKSQLLIQYTDMPLKQIAHTIGFKSFPHFSKTFKDRFGFSPKILRKKYLEKNGN
ncbi:helix-turn-helix domain-containing protein [Yeosuana marina]|uniref:helix-turn-helix domain-containing protein n=1 Tax=Yeosuana marina TaxID=1565536 RepID=UPI0014207EB2|nr:helix-turn-helix domain-containing protein [Yeosuana marina]